MKNMLLALLFVGGLALAGSDGPFFPLPNLAGLVCWILLAVAAPRLKGQRG